MDRYGIPFKKCNRRTLLNVNSIKSEDPVKKNIPVIVTLLSLAIAAGGISFGVRTVSQNTKLRAEAQDLRNQLKAQTIVADQDPADEDAAVVALKEIPNTTNDVTALQEQLAARETELARLRAALEDQRNNDRDPRQSFQDRMAQLKEDDPERYAEMVQRRTERQQQMRYDQATRLATFMNMDTSGMTEEELSSHNLLVQKLSDLWQKTGEFDPENPPDRETMREVFGSIHEIGDLMDQERTVMFRQLGTDVGLTDTDVENFASYVEDIIDATTMRPPRGMRGGWGGGGPPRDGGN